MNAEFERRIQRIQEKHAAPPKLAGPEPEFVAAPLPAAGRARPLLLAIACLIALPLLAGGGFLAYAHLTLSSQSPAVIHTAKVP